MGKWKWEALQSWRNDFKAKRGREPKLWIDKYCIDQNNIVDSLLCLPVYLTGCWELVALCGDTYLSRLWCLIEIFTFVEMGGESARFTLLVDEEARDWRQ